MKKSFYKNFSGENRFDFPEAIVRVTGGKGGEAFLIISEGCGALYDCGMACFHKELTKNIEDALKENHARLEFVLMSHTHYDHIGALPYVLKRWPEVKVCGAEKAISVFASPGALKTMERLGEVAREKFKPDCEKITAEGMRIDLVLKDGDCVTLGNKRITALETKGHTDCSVSYYIEPDKILLTSESTGVLTSPGNLYTSVLKDFDTSLEAAERLKKIDAEHIIIPHFGVIPKYYNKEYFDLYIKTAEEERNFFVSLILKGVPDEKILELHKEKHWSDSDSEDRVYQAYRLNTENVLKQLKQKINSDLED